MKYIHFSILCFFLIFSINQEIRLREAYNGRRVNSEFGFLNKDDQEDDFKFSQKPRFDESLLIDFPPFLNSDKIEQEVNVKLIDILVESLTQCKKEQISFLLDNFNNHSELDKINKEILISSAIYEISSFNPQRALEVASQINSNFANKELFLGNDFVSKTLVNWAKCHPADCEEWLRTQILAGKTITSRDVLGPALAVIAEGSVIRSLSLATEFGLREEDLTALWRELSRQARNVEQRSSLLQQIRDDDVEITKSDRNLIIRNIASALANQSFEKSAAWLKHSQLESEELAGIIEGLQYHQLQEDSGKWLGWISEKKLDRETLIEPVTRLVSDWCHSDFQAAGNWLLAQEEGILRQVAVEAFIKTVAPYEPAAALLWLDEVKDPEKRQQISDMFINDSL